MTENTNVKNDLSIGKKLKYALPEPIFRPLAVIYNTIMKLIPASVKYRMSKTRRRGKYPYRLLGDDDLAVQVGAPRDILWAGRSRAIHLAMATDRGRVLICEPDPENIKAMRAFLKENRLEDRVILAPVGAWKSDGELTFMSSANHPAANLLLDIGEEIDMPEDLRRKRNYQEIKIPVKTLDQLLEEYGLPTPRLISITTNGAEIQIVEGMKKTLEAGLPYISLASTGEGFHEYMDTLGYRYIARDDRGYTFERV